MQVRGLLAGIEFRRGLLTAVGALLTVNAVALALGFLAKALQGPIDEPLFDRIDAAGNTAWTDILEVVTQMGNVRQTQILAGVLALGLAIWFARAGLRWWMPLLVLPTTWIVSRLWQFFLAGVVERETVLISLVGTPIGNYPSGGVMRILVVSGTAAYLVVHYARVPRRSSIVLFAVAAVLGLTEAYCRMRLNQHWFTDIVGGLIYGGMFLGAVIVSIRAFDPRSADPPVAPQGERRQRARTH